MSRHTPRRWPRVLAILAVVVGIIVVTALTLYVRSASPDVEGTIEVRGITADVEILRDSLGVPHIRAASEADLLFAQGWVHAQDRLWQMEFFRRVGQGRLSEILGSGTVETDRFMRTIGVGRAARAQERLLDGTVRSLLEAYAAGVNAWIRYHRGALPPEFLILRAEPEPWEPLHSVVIAKVMSLDLSLYSTSELATRSAARLGESRARLLLPGYPEWGSKIMDALIPPPVPPAAARTIGSVSVVNASNAWVIGGSRTASGKPILANDMHLALRAPSLWYLAALHAPGLDVAGMTLPGIPWVIAGHNRAIAWGYSNAMVDDADLFAERIDPGDPLRYLTPAGSEPFEVIPERVRVRGEERPVEFDVRLTRHGPVLDGIEPAEDGIVLSLQWAAHDPSRSVEAIPALNRARGWAEFLSAVDMFEDPHQNIVYADTAGNIGYVMGGRVPVRGDGRVPPTFPVPGWTGDWDWRGWLPFERHPRALNPPRGYVVTANNRQAAGGAADLISTYYEVPFRADRIRQMIEASVPVDAPAVHAMQLDVRDALAERYRPLAIRAARAAGLDEVGRLLLAWDLEATSDSRGAALFYVWYEELRSRVAYQLYDDDSGWLPRRGFNAVLDCECLFWADGGSGTAFDSLAAAAATAADSIADGRAWGQLHRAHAGHPLSALAIIDWLFRFDVGGEPAGGSPTTVNVSHYGGRFPVDATAGPSQRHVVDMSDVDGPGGFVVPTGQSGLPFDRHYRDQWPLWRSGGLWRVPLEQTEAEARAVHRLVLISQYP